jgi:hypothetical protein
MIDGKIEEELRKYAAAAASYGRAVNNGHVKQSDKCFDEVEKAFEELKLFGDQGLQAVANLLQSDDEGVRLWSAAHLLNYPRFGALPVLEKLKQSPSILSLTAEVTIDQWRDGKLTY